MTDQQQMEYEEPWSRSAQTHCPHKLVPLQAFIVIPMFLSHVSGLWDKRVTW